MDDAAPPRGARPLGDLVGDLARDLSALVRKESELIRAEIHEKSRHAGRAIGDIAAGGLLMVAALLVLLEALVLALSKVIGPIWAALSVGIVVAAIGYAILRAGMKALSPDGLSPERSARQLKKDAELIKGNGS